MTMTLDEANSALRLFHLRLEQGFRDGDVESHRYYVHTLDKIEDIGAWTLPVQDIYEWVMDNYT